MKNIDVRMLSFNLLPDDKILDWSKLKQFADDNFKFYENSRKFSKRVENTVGKGEIAPLPTYIAVENIMRKGEIACNMQFILFSKFFLPYMALIFHFKCTLKCCLQFL